MTRTEFVDLVVEYCKTEAQPYKQVVPTADASLGAFVSDAIREFSGWSFCQFDDSVPFTIPSARIVDLRGGQFTKDIIWPVNVVLGGTQLRDFEDRPGQVTMAEIQTAYNATAGVAARWTFRLPNQLIFERSLSGVSGSSWVGGFVLHPVLDDNNDVVELPDEWLRPAVIWAVSRLIEPRSGGSSLDKMRVLDARAADLAVYLARLAVATWPDARPPILNEVRETE